MTDSAPWRQSWFPTPRSPSPLLRESFETLDMDGIVSSRDGKVADGIQVSLEVEAPGSVPSSPDRNALDKLIDQSETHLIPDPSNRESIISILPPSAIPPITLEPLRSDLRPRFCHWALPPRPTRSMSCPTQLCPPSRDLRSLRRHASVMSLSGMTIERMSLDMNTRLTILANGPGHEQNGRRLDGDIKFGWDDDECIPVLLPTSPSSSIHSAWSPSSPSSEDMSHNVPLYARDSTLKRSFSLSRSMRNTGGDRTTFGILPRDDTGLGLGNTLPLFHDTRHLPRRHRHSIHGRSKSDLGLDQIITARTLVPGPSSPKPSRPSSSLAHRASSVSSIYTDNTLSKGTRISPSIDQSPRLPAHIPIDNPDTPSTTPDSPLLTTPSETPSTERPVYRIQRRVSLLHNYRRPPASLPPSLPPLAPLPAAPSTDDHSDNCVIEREGNEKKHTLQPAFESAVEDEVNLSGEKVNNKRSSQHPDASVVDLLPRPRSLMSLDQIQRVQPHDHLNHPLHHPFLHHKSNPSVPFSTRSASTLSTHETPTTGAITPQTPLSLPSSHRQSKFTAFSGSSSSSTYSASDTSSIVGKYSSYNGGHHWGFGEKPDISTVFEEDDRSEGEVDVDFSAAPKSSHISAQSDQRLPLGPPLGYPKDTEPEAPRGFNGHSGVLPPTSHSHRHNTSDISTTTFVPRPGRSGTISSQASAHSSKSTKSVHPFASAINRPTSPPPLTRSKLQPPKPKSPLLHESFNMHQVHLAPVHQVTLSSSDDKDDEENCPVCCESLSFTFRLPGEKPHVVPECGHALHEECFSTVYGDIRPNDTRRNLGVCGVCRQPMRISDGTSYKKSGRNKMAKLTGNKSNDSHHLASSEGLTPTLPEAESDPSADDPLSDPLGMNSSSSRSLSSDTSGIIIPSISIKAEHSSISRTRRTGKQAIIAVISVVVPPAGDRGRYAAKSRPDYISRGGPGEEPPHLPPSPRSASSHPTDISLPSARSLPPLHGPDPFAHVLLDLQNRVSNYANSGLDALGQLRLFDLLSVRKSTLVREFHVYLFQDAIICIVEERKSAMRKIFSSSSSVRSSDSSHSAHGKGILKMKGRIYMKHVQRITDSSIPGELSLTIEMEDPSMESFILVFKDRGSHETWKRTLNAIIDEAKTGRPALREESNAKIAKLMGAGAPVPRSATSNKGFASPISQPSPSMGGINFDFTPQPSASSFGTSALTPRTPSGDGDLAFQAPLSPVHTPIDLVVILSLPPPSQTGSLPLKARLMRESLRFILALMGTKDRIALVVCEMGSNGVVRRTPFLNTTRYDSRHRLEAFVELVGQGHVDNDDFEVPVGRDEKQDVVTAMNTALDVVLQRKVKNPLSGMILISDTSENIKRAQMDLVNARLDAANTPVHALGYGKGHDPSPLWMISNHTNGTYTFVREWYHLRDSLAGIVGGMMTIAMTNMKLHINCQDNEFKVLKVSGASQAIVSTGGKYADVELRELRHGETRELMVEMDLVDVQDDHRYSGEGSDESGGPGSGTGLQSTQGSIHKSTSIGNLGLALDNLSVADANNMMYEDVLIDEIPVTEVDCSFHDPAAGRSVARLAHPVLLTTAILPPNAPPSSTPADSMVVRRKMELLASDMITRALLIASRKNFTHAIKIMKETKNILEKIAENLQIQLGRVQGAKSRRDMQNVHAIHGLKAVGGDLDTLIDALEEQQDTFDRDMRNFAAQQAVVLRTQKSWTIRTPSERLYCTPEIRHFIQMSADWQGK